MSEEKQAIAKKYMDALTHKDHQEQEEFITGLVSQLEVEVKKVPEHVFREVFLPYLTGEKTPTGQENPLAHWRGLVGSPSNPAEVVDLRGETLFVVPPLYDTQRIDTRKKGPSRLDRIFNDLVDESRVRPVASIEKFSQKMAEQTQEIQERTYSPSYSWEPVFNYYGLGKKADEVAEGEDKTIQGDKIDPSEFEF